MSVFTINVKSSYIKKKAFICFVLFFKMLFVYKRNTKMTNKVTENKLDKCW